MKKSILFLLLITSLTRLTAQIQIVTDRSDGVYEVGETIHWHITIDSLESYDSLRYAILPGALNPTEQGQLKIRDKTAELSYTFDRPGSVILEIRWGNPGSWINRMVSGGICAPEKMMLTSERPRDFHQFWKSKLEELDQVPMNAWTQSQALDDSTITYAKVIMDNIRGSKIYGQTAMPQTCDKYPALLIVQWAGVYGLSKDWVINRAKEGWLVLNLSPHDLPIDRDESFYREKSEHELKQYWAIGNDDPDSSYFLRMYLSCYRGVEYLKQHPSWNGETLVVTGDSQGGQQTIMTAGLHPDVTAAMALVPAGFDMLGPSQNRKGGWPHWYAHIEDKDSTRVREASRYYDVANFVPDIRCPVLVGIGLLDETCPPEGIIAGLNQLTTNKKIIFLPASQHQDRNGSQQPYREVRDQIWLSSLKEGKNPLTH